MSNTVSSVTLDTRQSSCPKFPSTTAVKDDLIVRTDLFQTKPVRALELSRSLLNLAERDGRASYP